MYHTNIASMACVALSVSFLFLSLIFSVQCSVLSSISEKSILISDGIKDGSNNQYEFLSLDMPINFTKNACVHVYGFLPCADNTSGYVFQVFSFGCLLILGDYFMSEGRSKLFDIFKVGFYGGIVFPLLTMFPRITLILSAGLSASPEVARSMVVSSVGVTVGYSIFALTVQWGACIAFGMKRMSSDQSRMEDEFERMASNVEGPRRGRYKQMILRRSANACVKADPSNKRRAGIMLLSLIPFIMVQLSEIFHSQIWRHSVILITLIISSSATILYFVYSYFDKDDQNNSLKHSRIKLMSDVWGHLQSLFDKVDSNKDGRIQISELKEATSNLVTTLLNEFDRDKDGEIDKTEFEEGFTKWMQEFNFSFNNEDFAVKNDTEEATVFSVKTFRASIQVIGGMLVVVFLARPFMMNIELLSISAGVPSFYIAFIVIPLARNSKNALSAYFCRREDKATLTSLTFSEIYRDVTMNNLMSMSIILAIVYTRGFMWDYSTEVLLVVFVGLIIGLQAYLRSSYPFWICVLAFALYFFSLLLIYLHFDILDKH